MTAPSFPGCGWSSFPAAVGRVSRLRLVEQGGRHLLAGDHSDQPVQLVIERIVRQRLAVGDSLPELGTLEISTKLSTICDGRPQHAAAVDRGTPWWLTLACPGWGGDY